MTVLLISGAVALIIAFAAFRRAPVATLLCACAVGAAIHFGAITMPTAIARPIGHARSAVQAWQAQQSAKLVCAVRETRALENDDAAQLQSLSDNCPPAAR